MYVVSIVAYQDSDFQGINAYLTKRRNWILTHVGLSAHAHNNYCYFAQEVEVHGWLLSGSEEFYYTLLLFFA